MVVSLKNIDETQVMKHICTKDVNVIIAGSNVHFIAYSLNVVIIGNPACIS